MFVDLRDWISAELLYHRYFSECSYAVQRVAMMLAKSVSGFKWVGDARGDVIESFKS